MTDEQTDKNQDNTALKASAPVKSSETDSSPKAVQAKKTNATKKSKGTGILVLIILILLAVSGAGGWYGYQFYLQTNQALSDIQGSHTALLETSQEIEDKVSARMQAVLSKQQEVADYVDVLRKKDQYLRKDWLLMESEYLIQLANHRLLFERDISTAIVALESADQRLRSSGDPGLLAVRKVIAQAVQELKQVRQTDLAGLSLQLSAINKEIDKLPLKMTDPKSRQQQEKEVASSKAGENIESWSQLPTVIWNDIKGLVKVRDHEKPIEPMLAPKERFFLVENVRLQIEQARLAMLSGQPEVYKERIATAISWVSEHFYEKAKSTQVTLASLTALANEPIAPELPDIAYTYQALQKYRLSQEIEPVHESETMPNKPAVQAN